MDRPRDLPGTPFSRALWRDLRALLGLVAVVLGVGLAPFLFVAIGNRWLAAEESSASREAEHLSSVVESGIDRTPGRSAPGIVQSGRGWIAEEVSYRSHGAHIAGRLFRPTSEGPHPAMVVAHGSGRARRSNYRRYAEALNRAGYALLAYDKRGVGDSDGVYETVGPGNSERMFDLLADDVIAGVDYLFGRPDILPSRIGVLGISQGGWIGPVAAAKSERISCVALVSGPAVSVGEEIYYSHLSQELEGSGRLSSDRELSLELAGFSGPHGFDPVPVLERLEVPSLWILGRGDRSIPIPETVAQLERLKRAGRPITPIVLPNVGHGMRDLDTGERIPVARLVTSWLAGSPPS